MKLIKYSTSIRCETTASEIQKMLSDVGARAVVHEYDHNGTLCGLSFKAFYNRNASESIPIFYKIPIDEIFVHRVFLCLMEEKHIAARFKTQPQAARVAWRIMKAWIESQISLVKIGRPLVEVFFQYAVEVGSGKTLFKLYESEMFKPVLYPELTDPT